ncbi:MAG: hypothetical protein K0U24_03240 [Gammaproteobacteria bacterium]|nr:hypothetical protein [Gammaproteobacteria bacterium]MCH9763231.1 hypothetical protein [Gammaproteobacteria bacterium]
MPRIKRGTSAVTPKVNLNLINYTSRLIANEILSMVRSHFEIDEVNASNDIQVFITHLIDNRVLIRC